MLATSRKSYGSDRHENFAKDVSMDKEELINCCNWIWEFFEGLFDIARLGIFFTIWCTHLWKN